MRVKVRQIGKALHPSEVVVEVQAADGTERLVVDRESIHGDTLSVGWPVAQSKGRFLVELPRETMSGTWRVWVRKNQVVPERESARAG